MPHYQRLAPPPPTDRRDAVVDEDDMMRGLRLGTLGEPTKNDGHYEAGQDTFKMLNGIDDVLEKAKASTYRVDSGHIETKLKRDAKSKAAIFSVVFCAILFIAILAIVVTGTILYMTQRQSIGLGDYVDEAHPRVRDIFRRYEFYRGDGGNSDPY